MFKKELVFIFLPHIAINFNKDMVGTFSSIKCGQKYDCFNSKSSRFSLKVMSWLFVWEYQADYCY